MVLRWHMKRWDGMNYTEGWVDKSGDGWVTTGG
jgi:hypothetical protein